MGPIEGLRGLRVDGAHFDQKEELWFVLSDKTALPPLSFVILGRFEPIAPPQLLKIMIIMGVL